MKSRDFIEKKRSSDCSANTSSYLEDNSDSCEDKSDSCEDKSVSCEEKSDLCEDKSEYFEDNFGESWLQWETVAAMVWGDGLLSSWISYLSVKKLVSLITINL